MAETDSAFDQLVFSGGGTRCFWQGGFLHVVRDALGLAPARIAALSGGAFAACGFITRRGLDVRETMIAAFADHDRNVPLHEPFDEVDGNSPHQRIYREVVSQVLDDAAAQAIATGPQFQVLIARPPSPRWATLSGAAMALLYTADSKIRSSPHLAWPEAAGLEGELVDANKAARDGRIVDLICAAATIPPAFEPPDWDGRPAIDAGMVSQAPMPDPDRGRTLILLTKRFDNIPEIEGRSYVMPSREVPADKIDFTDADKLRRTWNIGEEDGMRYLETLGRR
ncbi:patatin-like phospholipase family protein [Palleronia sediminis]|uniref:Patatin-like phospholipase family protein n=1 Tax=Palleronia sediminis TaxID=2547833 RepID=A0A4R6A6C4_9RHOB|nr:patatin-like phospholipase family protein [Palleronia sediminis]TDL76353.1 patatin-like phospholipase family protein [Palleronia sediminis]